MARPGRRTLLAAGAAGFGCSALVDVLLLHHVLQLHHLVSNVVAPTTLAGLRVNLLADGLFALAALGLLFAGLGGVWRAERRASTPLALRPLAGAGLVGFGGFDLVDVVVNHQLLGLHHATHGPRWFDPHWAAASVALTAGGWLLLRSSRTGT